MGPRLFYTCSVGAQCSPYVFTMVKEEYLQGATSLKDFVRKIVDLRVAVRKILGASSIPSNKRDKKFLNTAEERFNQAIEFLKNVPDSTNNCE